jgi:hypothetical protein
MKRGGVELARKGEGEENMKGSYNSAVDCREKTGAAKRLRLVAEVLVPLR